jgi:hypothetical protein
MFNKMKDKIRLLLREGLNEIDYEGKFSDVKTLCISHDALVEYLNDVRANAPLDTGERKKFAAKYPFLHAKSSFFKGRDWKAGDLTVDVDSFIKKMTEKPSNIFNTNEKILKSGSRNQFVYKTGIPAFRGLIYNQAENKFEVINTCPGAGSCRAICYALKGNYIQYANSYDLMTKRLNYFLNDPEGYENQAYVELKRIAKRHKALKGYKPEIVIRWNDSGDFFTKEYLDMADRVIKRLNDEGYNIKDYAYTKVADVATSGKLGGIKFSQGASKMQMKKIGDNEIHYSYVVPKELFKDLDFNKLDDEQELIKRVDDFFKFPKGEVITYDDMMGMNDKGVPKYHVIVTPNDGDDAAFRDDVMNVLLTQH